MKRRGFTRQALFAAAAAAMLAAFPAPAPAQQAGRAITIIVPCTPGSGPDILEVGKSNDGSRHRKGRMKFSA